MCSLFRTLSLYFWKSLTSQTPRVFAVNGKAAYRSTRSRRFIEYQTGELLRSTIHFLNVALKNETSIIRFSGARKFVQTRLRSNGDRPRDYTTAAVTRPATRGETGRVIKKRWHDYSKPSTLLIYGFSRSVQCKAQRSVAFHNWKATVAITQSLRPPFPNPPPCRRVRPQTTSRWRQTERESTRLVTPTGPRRMRDRLGSRR